MKTQRSPRNRRRRKVRAPNAAFGLVLTGGAAFGAWEVGALHALWNVWREKHPNESPPITIVAGTSTGALIAPFALLRDRDLDHVTSWYTSVCDNQISALSPAVLLTAALFVKWGVSLAVFGDPKARRSALEQEILDSLRTEDTREVFRTKDLLFQNFWTALEEEDPATGQSWRTLENCANAWKTGKRLVACAIDFESGTPDTASNSPSDLDPKHISTDSRLFRAMFASAVPPLMGPPVPLTHGKRKTPHFDGGIYSEAPFDALFETAETSPGALTHVILLSSYPEFPGTDVVPFPEKKGHKPRFEQIGLRFDSLLSEANVTRDTRIARAALRLREKGLTKLEVHQMTGLTIPDRVPELIEVFPRKRLGWNNSHYDPQKMKTWVDEGKRVAADIFRNTLP